MTHAFETLDCIAVEFRTHSVNQQSRHAIARWGATQQGCFAAIRIRKTAVCATLSSARSWLLNSPPYAMKSSADRSATAFTRQAQRSDAFRP